MKPIIEIKFKSCLPNSFIKFSCLQNAGFDCSYSSWQTDWKHILFQKFSSFCIFVFHPIGWCRCAYSIVPTPSIQYNVHSYKIGFSLFFVSTRIRKTKNMMFLSPKPTILSTTSCSSYCVVNRMFDLISRCICCPDNNKPLQSWRQNRISLGKQTFMTFSLIYIKGKQPRGYLYALVSLCVNMKIFGMDILLYLICEKTLRL